MSLYTIHSGDECDGDPCYSVLKGPDGFACWLTEPEDRSWHRDGADVVKRLEQLEAQLAQAKRQLAEVTQQYTAAIQHSEELVTTPRAAQLLSKLIQAERDIESLQQCQCDGCEERLEGDAYCLRCVAKLREQFHAQSVTDQDNLTEIQLLKAQIVNREKEVDRMMAQRNFAEAKLLVLERREQGYLSELDDYARTVLALRSRVKACEAEHGLHRVQP